MNSKTRYQSKISEFFGRKVTVEQEPKQQEIVKEETTFKEEPTFKEETPVEFILILPPVAVSNNEIVKEIKQEKENPSKDFCFKCKNKDCSKSFETFKSLKIHSRVHLRGYECEKCDQLFMMKGNLRKHKCRKMECSICRKVFKTFEGFKLHVDTFHCKI